MDWECASHSFNALTDISFMAIYGGLLGFTESELKLPRLQIGGFCYR